MVSTDSRRPVVNSLSTSSSWTIQSSSPSGPPMKPSTVASTKSTTLRIWSLLGPRWCQANRRVSQAHHAAPADEPVQPVAGAHAQEARVQDGIHDPMVLGGPVEGEPHLVALGDGAGQPEAALERLPDVILVGLLRSLGGDRRRGPAWEVGEVLRQRAQVHGPALAQRVVLRLPVVAADDAALHQPDHGAAALASLDEVLERHERPVLTLAAAVGEPPRRLPRGHRALLGVATEGHANRAALAGLDLVASHEPGVDAGAGGDRLPHLLGGGVDGDLVADLEFVRHG